jgi:hypothetical protein
MTQSDITDTPAYSYKELVELLKDHHVCTTTATTALRFRRDTFAAILNMPILEQAHQCMHCGKIDWRPVPTVEEDKR